MMTPTWFFPSKEPSWSSAIRGVPILEFEVARISHRLAPEEIDPATRRLAAAPAGLGSEGGALSTAEITKALRITRQAVDKRR